MNFEYRCVHSDSTLSDGNTQGHTSKSLPTRLGSFDRFVGRLPLRSYSPTVPLTVRIPISEQNLCVLSPAVLSQRLPMSLHENSSHSNCTPPLAGHPDLLLSRRLASSSEILNSPSFSSSKFLRGIQELGFIINQKKSMLSLVQTPVYLGASLDILNLLARPVSHRVVSLQS